MKMTDPIGCKLDFGYHAGTDLFLDSIMQRHPPHTNLDLTSWSPDSATGNTRTDGTGHAFVYDAWNRLAAVRDGVGGTLLETYAYDGTGRRLSQTLTAAGAQAAGGLAAGATAGITDLYYSAQWQVLEEQQAGVATAQYVWSPVYVDALVLRDRATGAGGDLGRAGSELGERLYVIQDANFNVTALTDASGNVVERYAYDPYGQVTVLNPNGTVKGTGTVANSGFAWQYLHQGGRYDLTTGLYDFRNRAYSPTLMRWMQEDPLGYVDGANPYAFGYDAPVNKVDPLGTRVSILSIGSTDNRAGNDQFKDGPIGNPEIDIAASNTKKRIESLLKDLSKISAADFTTMAKDGKVTWGDKKLETITKEDFIKKVQREKWTVQTQMTGGLEAMVGWVKEQVKANSEDYDQVVVLAHGWWSVEEPAVTFPQETVTMTKWLTSLREISKKVVPISCYMDGKETKYYAQAWWFDYKKIDTDGTSTCKIAVTPGSVRAKADVATTRPVTQPATQP